MAVSSSVAWLSGRAQPKGAGRATGKPRRRSAARRPSFVPRLEGLEDRTVLSTLLVTSGADDGSSGTLRAVLAAAKAGDTITFAPSLDGQTITLTQGQLTVSQNLDIEGPGAGQLTVSGNSATRVFEISGGATVTIAGLTIAHGAAAEGGGIENAGGKGSRQAK